MLARLITGLPLASALVLSSCIPLLGTKGSLHDYPSTGSELPFQTGLYAPDGAPDECEQHEFDYVLKSAPRIGRFMAFAEDGTFAIGRSDEAIRADGSASAYAAWFGNYRTDGTAVDARAVGPGADTNYSRIVRSYHLTSIGTDSFVTEWTFTADGQTGCGRQRYTRTGSTIR